MKRESITFVCACLAALYLALAGAPELRGNQIVLPGSIQMTGSGRDHDPAVAFNTVDKTWLMVWREASTTI
ncbi:MAG TPA: hypothetical protein VMT52_20385, partial [Planctomycetota bacterium]|nr:hypothetical protein [Planctomycetota bacterium]